MTSADDVMVFIVYHRFPDLTTSGMLSPLKSPTAMCQSLPPRAV
jgi:hypothetical protein